ncbi:MAG: DUF933 domain-containing protein [Candidatus Omnitrophica bacterium]|nr:DUF933 domain-containing protein [Candidatus Omnitrophota bacterium]
MKICCIALPSISPGKYNLKDSRLDQVDAITKSKKKTYIQVEVIPEEKILDADAILVDSDSRMDLVLRDLEFVETRLSRVSEEGEKSLLLKLKSSLEKEEFIAQMELSVEEKLVLSGYSVWTNKPVVLAAKDQQEDANGLLLRAVEEAGYVSFFTTGEKETRAWLIRKGVCAWEAAGAIHSDIQKGFIRAEIISFSDFIQHGGETVAKQAGKLRVEQKEYIMQDTDLANFRFNK